jgi:hypothetical protein
VDQAENRPSPARRPRLLAEACVEGFGAIDVRNRNDDHLKLHVDIVGKSGA